MTRRVAARAASGLAAARRAALLGVAMALAGCAAAPFHEPPPPIDIPPDAIVLRVEVLDVEGTDWAPPCDAGEDDCIPWTTWTRYRARVREPVVGAWRGERVEFAFLQHAMFIRDVTDDCYVVLVPASDDFRGKLGVPFIAERLFSPWFEHDRPEIRALRALKKP